MKNLVWFVHRCSNTILHLLYSVLLVFQHDNISLIPRGQTMPTSVGKKNTRNNTIHTRERTAVCTTAADILPCVHRLISTTKHAILLQNMDGAKNLKGQSIPMIGGQSSITQPPTPPPQDVVIKSIIRVMCRGLGRDQPGPSRIFASRTFAKLRYFSCAKLKNVRLIHETTCAKS